MFILFSLLMVIVALIPFYIMYIFFDSYSKLQSVLEGYEIIFCDICHKYLKIDQMLVIKEEGKDDLYLCSQCTEDFYNDRDNRTRDE